MPFFNYGSKNGMSTIVKLIKHICRVYLAYTAAIQTFINSSSLTTEQKAQVIDWLEAGVTVCGLIVGAVEVTYES